MVCARGAGGGSGERQWPCSMGSSRRSVVFFSLGEGTNHKSLYDVSGRPKNGPLQSYRFHRDGRGVLRVSIFFPIVVAAEWHDPTILILSWGRGVTFGNKGGQEQEQAGLQQKRL